MLSSSGLALGDLAEWVSACGTLVALVLATIAARAARGAYRIESERDRVYAEERKQQAAFVRRGQAALVSAWLGNPNDSGTWGAYVRNASETPVYRAHLSVVNLDDPDISETIDLAVVPPSTEPTFHATLLGSAADAPGAPEHRVEMTFTDSAGIRWLRDQQGRLAEVLPELTIWADTQRTVALDRFTAEFLSSHQVVVKFRTRPIETLRDDFLAAVAAGETPDILIGAHDWIGLLAERRAIDPIQPSRLRQDAFTAHALSAMRYDGQLYGVPYAADSICLLRNTDLAPQAPGTVEEMIEHGRQLCALGQADVPLALQVGEGDCFYVYPFFTSAGGRLLTGTGEWDLAGMTGTGSAAAFARLGALGERGERVLSREIDRDRAVALFTQGKTPYLVCAPWGIGEAREAGMRLAVSPMPPFAAGLPPRSMVAVHGFFMSSVGGNKDLAQDLMVDYLTRTDVTLALYAAQPRTPALRSALATVCTEDELATPFHRECERGDVIPSTQDSAAVFTAVHRAEVDLVAGADAAGTMRALAQSLARIGGPRRTAPPRI